MMSMSTINMGNIPLTQDDNEGHFPLAALQQVGECPGVRKPSSQNTPEQIYRRIRRRLAATEKTELGASLEAGMGRDAIRDIRRKPKNLPSIRTLELLAPVLNTTPWWLAFNFGPESPADGGLADSSIHVVGYVGAGAQAHFYAVSQGALDEVTPPSVSADRTVAVEVRGDSLGVSLNRSLVFYDDFRPSVTDDLLGRLCVIGLSDERVLIKTLARSRSGVGYDLLANNPADEIRSAQIAWAAPVKLIAPR